MLIEPDYVKDGKKGKDVSNTVQSYLQVVQANIIGSCQALLEI